LVAGVPFRPAKRNGNHASIAALLAKPAPKSVLCGAPHNIEIGAAWRRTSKDDRVYHSVKLDDPSFTAPIYANLFEGEDGEHALIWSR
jgi:uncharacterized protein (DUF736 family)